jgi:hypothetical protein
MSFALLAKMLAKHVGLESPKPSYPLYGNCGPLDRARLGGVLKFDGAMATLITAEAAGSFVKAPPEMSSVNGYGKIIDGEFVLHHFYIGDYFLQVISARSGIIVAGEIKLMQRFAEITPSTPEEWDLWINGVDGNQPLLTGPTIKWQDATEYTRVWSPGNGTAEPKRYVEALDVGQSDSTLPVTTINTMLFGRALNPDQTEWLQLSTCRSNGERWIEAYVGLSLESGELLAI